MRITYTAPVRLPFNLPKDSILTYHADWIKIIEHSQKDAPFNIQLGNYGWGLAHLISGDHDIENSGKQFVYGDCGIEDPAWFFQNYFTLSLQENYPTDDFTFYKQDKRLAALLLQSSESWWQCRIIDNTLAVLVLNVEFSLDLFENYLSEKANQGGKSLFTEFGNLWSERVLSAQRDKLHEVCSWGQENLIEPIVKKNIKIDQTKEFFIREQSPIYKSPYASGKDFHALWSHCVYVLSLEEKQRLKNTKQPFIELFAQENKPEIENWLSPTKQVSPDALENVYGWAASAVLKDESFGDQWLDALCISQYYYSTLDIADTTLPFSIARQRTSKETRKNFSVQRDSQNMKETLKILTNDYYDILIRANGEGYRALNQYYSSWRFEKLIEGLSNKITLLEDLIVSASESIQQETQNKIQYILTFITILSLISLFAGLHDYLASGYNPRNPEFLPGLALTVSKVMVLAISVVTALLAFLAYFIISRKK